MSDKDGGPAFPHRLPRVEREGSALHQRTIPVDREGMTLRDYFTAKALTGLVATIPGPGCAAWDYYSVAAYKIADAMLTERVAQLPPRSKG